jgi:hypothetical protein
MTITVGRWEGISIVGNGHIYMANRAPFGSSLQYLSIEFSKMSITGAYIVAICDELRWNVNNRRVN